MVAGYVALVEAGKRIFYNAAHLNPPTRRHFNRARLLRRRAARFTTGIGRGLAPVRNEETR